MGAPQRAVQKHGAAKLQAMLTAAHECRRCWRIANPTPAEALLRWFALDAGFTLHADLGWRPQQVAHLDTVSQATRSLDAKLRDPSDPTELGDTLPDTRFDPEATTLDQTLRAALAGAMARLLTDQEQRFLRAYVGFTTGQKVTLEEVGAAEGLTRERVRQVIASALATLRADPVIQAYGARFAA